MVNQNPNPNPKRRRAKFKDPTAEVLHGQWLGLSRELETREAEFEKDLEAAKARGAREAEMLLALKDQRTGEYEADRDRIRAALAVCEQDLNAAHVATAKHCGTLSIRYVPGSTTDQDVLRVPCLSASEAAASKNLKYGASLITDATSVLKIITAVLCALVASVSWGALLTGLNLKRPLANLPGACFAALLGLATSLIVWRFLSRAWTTIGTKDGLARPKPEVRQAFSAALVQTMLVLAGLMTLDALGLIRVNAAKAQLNPLFAMPIGLAIIAAGFVNLAYVSSMSYAAYAEGYNKAAGGVVQGVIRSDEAVKRDARKSEVLVQAAIDGLSQVKVVEQRIATYQAQLKELEQGHTLTLQEIMRAMPEEPSLSPSQRHELAVLRDKVAVAKERLDAHLSSRSVNYAVVESAEESIE